MNARFTSLGGKIYTEINNTDSTEIIGDYAEIIGIIRIIEIYGNK